MGIDDQTTHKGKIIWALPPETVEHLHSEMEIYARFMQHVRLVPTSRIEMKILSAIQFTADMLDQSDALVAKTLVDLGFRAPRAAFPAEFLTFVDRSLQRNAWSFEGPSESVRDLHAHWGRIGDNRFIDTVPDRYVVAPESEGAYS